MTTADPQYGPMETKVAMVLTLAVDDAIGLRVIHRVIEDDTSPDHWVNHDEVLMATTRVPLPSPSRAQMCAGLMQQAERLKAAQQSQHELAVDALDRRIRTYTKEKEKSA